MLFSQSSDPTDELIEATAAETGIDATRIKVWLALKRQKADEKSDQSDFSLSKDETHDFSDDNSANEEKQLKIDESMEKSDEVKAEVKNEQKSESKKESEEQSNRRMRTLISPDQAEVLYREYLEVDFTFRPIKKRVFQDNCPPRQRLEEIAAQTGLKRRVVQVWFQNTRARERKGQYRSVSMFAQKSTQPANKTQQIKPKFSNQSPASLLMLTEASMKAKEGK